MSVVFFLIIILLFCFGFLPLFRMIHVFFILLFSVVILRHRTASTLEPTLPPSSEGRDDRLGVDMNARTTQPPAWNDQTSCGGALRLVAIGRRLTTFHGDSRL